MATPKYPLLVYRMVSNRYRPAAILFIVMGILGQLPRLVPQLTFSFGILTPDILSAASFVALALGCALLAAAILEKRASYVRLEPDYLLINAPQARVAVAYQRINTVKPVKVGELYQTKKLRGRARAIMRPLSGKTGVEVLINEFPLPEKTIRRRLNRFLLSPRDTGFVLVVNEPRELAMALGTAMERVRESARNAEREGYVPPLERSFTR